MMKGIVISMLVVLAMAHLMVQQGEAIVNCGQVDSNLAPCISYLSKRGSLDPACCAGVQNIKNLAQTTADKQAACECCMAARTASPMLTKLQLLLSQVIYINLLTFPFFSDQHKLDNSSY
ncbi:non-specific lipid-transfer protein 1-like [Malus sylvestris]|uniref:non-specific lipid-transfer protein 1-like n=1 Tax=Malus sylvestris TaxID=3752 RepID=UPI0010AAC932|nr:non-specific lipid-transfer protein A-like [Malus domestica]XP_050125003.1 non-specific lipid-transfer protein 1-like [Malus sylvestris]